MDFETWLKKRGKDPAKLSKKERAALYKTFRTEQRGAVPQTPPAGNGPSEAARATAIKATREIGEAARGLDLEASPYQELLEHGEAVDAIYRQMTLDAAAARRTQPSQPAVPGSRAVEVFADEADKFYDHAVRGMAGSLGIATRQVAKPHVGQRRIAVAAEDDADGQRFSPLPVHEIVARCALLEGQSDAREWPRWRLAEWAMSRARYTRSTRAANQHSGFFSGILSNVADLSLQAGFDVGMNETTFSEWTTQREVSDFRQGTRAALHVGNLQETVEGAPFPEMEMADSSYNAQLGLWGVTARLTFQAMTNDELDEFMRKIFQAGGIAARTFDRQCAKQLMDATWTNDLTSSAALGTAGNLDEVRADLRAKLDKVGNRMGISAAFLLHPPELANAADEAVGLVGMAGGRSSALAGRLARRIVPLEVDPLADSALSSSASETAYFVTGNPSMVDTVLAQYLQGMRSPMIAEFDPGAVAGQSWKIFQGFSATVATHTDSAGNSRVSGMQKATA